MNAEKGKMKDNKKPNKKEENTIKTEKQKDKKE
jgi:hypothetical protein